MKSYVTLTDAVAEISVRGSRFIAYAYGIKGESDAAARIAALRKKHYDATHVCYAYVADECGFIAKSSDDGEPSGTAGAPIMTAVAPLCKALVAVVRYFGGTKLGVGGLIRAYGDAAAAVIACTARVTYTESNIYTAKLGYAEFEKCRRVLSSCKMLRAEYGNAVECEFAAPIGVDIITAISDNLGFIPDIRLKENGRYVNY